MIDWPTTDQSWHDWYVRLDAQYGTKPGEPLHHDGRCPLPGHIKRK